MFESSFQIVLGKVSSLHLRKCQNMHWNATLQKYDRVMALNLIDGITVVEYSWNDDMIVTIPSPSLSYCLGCSCSW